MCRLTNLDSGLRENSHRHYRASHVCTSMALSCVGWPLILHRTAINAARDGPAGCFLTVPKTQTTFLHACSHSAIYVCYELVHLLAKLLLKLITWQLCMELMVCQFRSPTGQY